MLKRLLGTQPVLITTVITAAVGLAVAYGAPIPADAKAPLIALLVALATGFLHQTVSSPATVAAVATDAANKTAARLTDATVGAAEEVTAAGEGVVTGVAGEVLNNVGGLVASLTKGA